MNKLKVPLLLLSLFLSANRFSHHSFPVHFVPDEMVSVSGGVTKFSCNYSVQAGHCSDCA